MLESRPHLDYPNRPHRGPLRSATWVRVSENLGPGVLLCHEAMVSGWPLRAELVMTAVGSLQLRVNGENCGEPLMDCTMAAGRRQYQAMLRRLGRPRQLLLPI